MAHVLVGKPEATFPEHALIGIGMLRTVSAPVFISYSSKDQKIAETIYQALETRGQKCWISCRDVHPGENFQEAIVRALRQARVMVLVFSSNANNSDEIKKEVVLAGRHHVTVVPVRVEDVLPNDAFSYELATRQWIDLFKNWEQELERLATRVAGIVATAKPQYDAAPRPEPTTAPSPILPPRARSNKRSLAWAGAAVVVLLLIGGGVALYLQPFTLSGAAAAAEGAAWQQAQGQGSQAAFAAYLQAFPQGAHADQAQLRIESLTLAAVSARNTNFDGTWSTTVTCPPAPGSDGYSLQFEGEIKDGGYHGHYGNDGPGSFTLDGRIGPDGTAALFGNGSVGNSRAGGGAPIGTPYSYHVSGQFQSGAGAGKRTDGRACSLSFVKK
jgi:TIR domain